MRTAGPLPRCCTTSSATSTAALITFSSERKISHRELLDLTSEAVQIATGSRTRILVNDRIDIALAAAADGVHLRSDSIRAERVRQAFGNRLLIGASCHSIDDVLENQTANLVVFGPVFFSPGKGPPQGLKVLARVAAASHVPVFALGGVDRSNAQLCVDAGAAGIAAIRLFQ